MGSPRPIDLEMHKRFTLIHFFTMRRFGDITSFREVATIGAQYASRVKFQHYRQFMQDLLTKPEYEGIIVNREQFSTEKLDESTPIMLVEAVMGRFAGSVDAASLVFAHSVLDAAAMDYCRLIGDVAPEEWVAQVEQRQIGLKQVLESSPEVLLSQTLDRYLEQLAKESLLKKLDALHAKCRPEKAASEIEGYCYDRDRMQQLDRLRHEVVHGDAHSNPLPQGDNDIAYMQKTCWYLMAMVHERYGLGLVLEMAPQAFGEMI